MIVYNQQAYPQELGTGQGISIALYGCALCSVASLLSVFGIQIDPLSLNDLFIKNNVFANNGSGQYDLIDWAKVCIVYTQISLAFNNSYPSTPADINLIDAQLAKGCPVIVGVDIKHNPNTTQPTHFVCIYKKNDNGTYQCVDSWYNDDTSFNARYAVNGMSAAQCILQAISYNGTVTPQGTYVDAETFTKLVTKATEDDLFHAAGYKTPEDVVNRIASITATVDSLNAIINDKNSAISSLNQQVSDLTTQVTSKDNTINTLEEQAVKVPVLTNQILQLTSDLNLANEANAVCQRSNAQLKSQLAQGKPKGIWAKLVYIFT